MADLPNNASQKNSLENDVEGSAGGVNVSAWISKNLLRGDILLALSVITLLVVLVLPMPTWALDAALAISITFSVLILITALFIQKPLDFNTFPTVLLLATMLRLALNMASTRLILSDGHQGPSAAGQVIEAFGNFVMGGNFVIGIIVFTILVIVNFIVITKGSGRIAEVTARFSLDAMPGKQMAIDADLSTGLIDEDEARTRRKELEEESTFFGAMDGASKFVRGDAIAGILITFINVVAGMIIGVAQNDLSFAEAAESYTRLTVGDGLVSNSGTHRINVCRFNGYQSRRNRCNRSSSWPPISRPTQSAWLGQLLNVLDVNSARHANATLCHSIRHNRVWGLLCTQ